MSNTSNQLQGNEEGIAVWLKMAASQDKEVLSYVNMLSNAAMKHGNVYFTDLIAQRVKPLNNQKTFFMQYSATDGNWNVTLFHTPAAQ